jgi:hypothetical protein
VAFSETRWSPPLADRSRDDARVIGAKVAGRERSIERASGLAMLGGVEAA